VAAGIINLGDESKIMCGPVSAIEKKSNKYVVLTPGVVKKSDIASSLAKAFRCIC
jgi:hypothetical protein